MPISITQLEAWLTENEDENLEFKSAAGGYSADTLLQYCTALANEDGGRIILGVSDKRPRQIVGTQAFLQHERTRAGLMEKLPLCIEADVVLHPNGRVLVFTVPPRPIGIPLKADGIYWERHGDSLRPMSEEKLKQIFNEAGHDFSADICPGTLLDDLDSNAIEDFRKRWIIKSGNPSMQQLTQEQLLRDAEAITDRGVTYAALILFGTAQGLGKYRPQSEVVFEYRTSEAAGPAQDRKEYRLGFFSFYDELWNTINLRNNKQHYQEGLFVYDIPTFEERSVREAVLNAICHRDYRLGGSIFIRQYPSRLEVVSPGGFPPGISPENILDRQNPRNRRIAEILAKCGLVERSGQGVNLMFELAIRQSKLLPSFDKSDQYQVALTLDGQVQDPRFVSFLEKVGRERNFTFGTQDLILLDHIHGDMKIPDKLRPRITNLVENGIIEPFGRGRGAKFILSRHFYAFVGRRGVYTRKRGLDRPQKKMLLLNLLQNCGANGCKLEELSQVHPELSRFQIHGLLKELKKERKVRSTGRTRAGRWYIV